MADLKRRSFLGGAGLLASAAAACRPRRDPYAPAKRSVPLPWNQRLGGESHVLSTCGLCAAGCGIRVRVVDGHAVKIEGNPASPINRGRLCARGQAGLQLLYHPDRVRSPMQRAGERGENRWQPIPWDEAIGRVAAELGKLRAAGEPQALVLLDGEERGATHGLWARFLRAFGTPNHVGHGATGTGAMLRAMVAMTGSPSLPGYDFENARLVLLVGTGVLESSPQSMSLARAVAQGARPRLVCAWPRLPPSGAMVDEWLPLAPDGQAAFLLALAHVLLRDGLADESSLPEASVPAGADPRADWRAPIMSAFSPAQVASRTGVSAKRVERLARELAAIRPSLVGVDEGMADAATVGAGLLLNTLLGAVDTGGGMLTDEPGELPAWGACAIDGIAARGLAAGAIDGRDPAWPGAEGSRILALPEAILSGKPYAAKALLLHHSNPAYSKPDPARWRQALAKTPLVVSFSPLLDESARFADLVLPDHTFLERWDIVSPGRGTRLLSLRQPVVRPRLNTLQTGEVVLRLATALGGGLADAFPWKDYREAVASGLAGFARGASDVVPALEGEGVWVRPNDGSAPARGGGGGTAFAGMLARLPYEANRPASEVTGFPFLLLPFRGSGYAEGGSRHLPWLAELPMPGRDPWRTRIEVSPRDARELRIEDGDDVVVESPHGRLVAVARVHGGMRSGVLGLPLGGGVWPPSADKPGPAILLAGLVDERTGQWLACATRARLGRAG